jgi:uncharacterized protein YfdQ (DUF2303 family)
VIADLSTSKIKATFNDHGPHGEPAGWAGLHAVLDVQLADRWKEWIAKDRKELTQVEFAEFIEDHKDDFIDPDAGHMLNVALTLQAKTNVVFKQKVRLDNGDTGFEYDEETATKAGEKGDLEVPASFDVRLQPYVNGDPYRRNVRLRTSITGGRLRFTFLIDQPNRILEEAFKDVVRVIEDGSPQQVIEEQEATEEREAQPRRVIAENVPGLGEVVLYGFIDKK